VAQQQLDRLLVAGTDGVVKGRVVVDAAPLDVGVIVKQQLQNLV
jgi:hypothetical protein